MGDADVRGKKGTLDKKAGLTLFRAGKDGNISRGAAKPVYRTKVAAEFNQRVLPEMAG
jgi:hypothetical protein